MFVVAAQEFGLRRPNGAAMAVHHNFQLVLVQVDHSVHHPPRGLEKDDGEQCHLKLRADPDEAAAHRFDQPIPAELYFQDVIVGVWLQVQNHSFSLVSSKISTRVKDKHKGQARTRL